jgi:hypothetical protein
MCQPPSDPSKEQGALPQLLWPMAGASAGPPVTLSDALDANVLPGFDAFVVAIITLNICCVMDERPVILKVVNVWYVTYVTVIMNGRKQQRSKGSTRKPPLRYESLGNLHICFLYVVQ